MFPTLPDAVPQRSDPLSRAFGRVVLRLLGWRITGEVPDRPKFVVIVAPHRSNWDFVVGLAVRFALGIDASWIGKHTLFRGPWAGLLRRWGGIPVDRRSPHDTVATVVDLFAKSDRMVLAVAPEGTRKRGSEWKTGFWHIAHGADVPILPIAFDWTDRTVRLMPIVHPRDLEQDMRNIRALYAGVRGRYP